MALITKPTLCICTKKLQVYVYMINSTTCDPFYLNRVCVCILNNEQWYCSFLLECMCPVLKIYMTGAP